MKDLGSALQLRMFNNRLEKHFFVVLNNNVEGTISPTMHLLADITIYHTSNSHECMGVNGEALQLHAVYKKPYFLLQVTRESVSALQVTWESVSGTASHARCVWTCNEIEGSYVKIIITIVPSYTGKNITRLLPLALLLVLRTRNNTDGNKLVIFSGIASYYGDNYIE